MKLKKIIKYFHALTNLHIYGKDNKFYDFYFAYSVSECTEIKNSSVYKLVASGIDVVDVYIKGVNK